MNAKKCPLDVAVRTSLASGGEENGEDRCGPPGGREEARQLSRTGWCLQMGRRSQMTGLGEGVMEVTGHGVAEGARSAAETAWDSQASADFYPRMPAFSWESQRGGGQLWGTPSL